VLIFQCFSIPSLWEHNFANVHQLKIRLRLISEFNFLFQFFCFLGLDHLLYFLCVGDRYYYRIHLKFVNIFWVIFILFSYSSIIRWINLSLFDQTNDDVSKWFRHLKMLNPNDLLFFAFCSFFPVIKKSFGSFFFFGCLFSSDCDRALLMESEWMILVIVQDFWFNFLCFFVWGIRIWW
jgi:hypothetical protein